MKKSKNIKRYMKKEYGPRKMPYPKSLEFLSTSGINFHAVVEDDSSGRIVRTIEIKPTTLKRLIEDIELLYMNLSDSDEAIKRLRGDIKVLRADNKKLIKNHEESAMVEFKIKEYQEKINKLNAELKSSKLLDSEIKALEHDLNSLRKKSDGYKSELSRLEQERKDTIYLESENADLRKKIEDLTQANEALMKNIEGIYEPKIKRKNDGFFGSDKKNKIINNKPYQGGKPS